MAVNKTSIVSESKLFSEEKQWKYRDINKKILSDLQDALILFKLKTGKDHNIGKLEFSDKGEIITSTNNSNNLQQGEKGPTDISGKIENINIINLKKELFTLVANHPDIINQDKEQYYIAISNFLKKEFLESRNKAEKNGNTQTIYHYFRKYYIQHTKKLALSKNTEMLYQDISITLANMLYHINSSFLDLDGKVNEKGVQHLATIFKVTIDHIPELGGSKAFHKIFHDGDFNFLRRKDARGEPWIGTFDHYIQSIIYLIDSNSFNAYEAGGIAGKKERIEKKKAFLNGLFIAGMLEYEPQTKSLSNKTIVHTHLATQRKDMEDLNHPTRYNTWEMGERLKQISSKLLKVGGRTTNIQDESGLRATYYGDLENQNQVAKNISTMLDGYLSKIIKIPGIQISNIFYTKKGTFITENHMNSMIKELEQKFKTLSFSQRENNKDLEKNIQLIITKYNQLSSKSITKELTEAFNLANGKTTRGGNGNYNDFKLNITYNINAKEYNQTSNIPQKLTEDITLTQEISLYPIDNDLNMGHHEFLDLEKKIFNRIKNMNNEELGKSISLNRLRYFTETAIKDISFALDLYEDKIKNNKLPNPKNNDYQYLTLNEKKMSLKNMIYRNKENTEKFDEMIAEVLNYFIKKNKLIYLNKDKCSNYGNIAPQDLQIANKEKFKTTRFCSSDILSTIASDAKYSNYNICFYTPNTDSLFYKNFYQVNLGDLGDIINLQQKVKNKQTSETH